MLPGGAKRDTAMRELSEVGLGSAAVFVAALGVTNHLTDGYSSIIPP